MARWSAFTCVGTPSPPHSLGRSTSGPSWSQETTQTGETGGNPWQSLCTQFLCQAAEPLAALGGGGVSKDRLSLRYLSLHQPSSGETDVHVLTQKN